ncbi:MAG: peptidoglycan editing factor PgeF [Geminocystis sp.]|nr:peptidoglycan editing factor PgeF [Geminocystis sp.]MCS7148156.1 peptidoglycan editing factor PgeF [Geminocystis sp.]MDW8116507.1 peptidoglycan editing factor PgeF [Geminocystis sp.]MDW8462010.1 peptidoglycan editing factor PgeF [Geminocystis sp.]
MHLWNNPSLWQWQQTDRGRYLTCSLLAKWPHGFFTSHFHGCHPRQLVQYLHPRAKVYYLKQIHSNILFTTTQIESSETQLEGDGIVTDSPLQSVWCASADCTPVLIASPDTGKVMAIHSGWRGSAKEIVPKAISLMASLGCKKENLLFALGPAIHGKIYQVDENVALQVLKTVIKHTSSSSEILHIAYENQLVYPDFSPGKVRLHVSAVIYQQIVQQGIDSSQIAIAPYCTYQDSSDFFSYRRTGEKKVQYSGIVSI